MTLDVRQMQRSPGTATLDRFLMLYAGRIFAEARGSPGATLLQKVMFWIRLAAVTEKLTAPSYGFLRYHYGPYSADVAADGRFLREVGLVQQGAFIPTARGMEIVAAWEPILRPNDEPLFRAVRLETQKRARWSAARAKREAYQTRIRGDAHFLGVSGTGSIVVTLKDVRIGVHLLRSGWDVRPRVPEDVLAEMAMDLRLSPEDIAASRRSRDSNRAEASELLAV